MSILHSNLGLQFLLSTIRRHINFVEYFFGVMDDPGNIAGAIYIFIKHADIRLLTGDIAFILCMALHNLVPNEVFGAQKIRGTWVTRLNSNIAKISLLQHGAITIGNHRVVIHEDNPYVKSRVQTERVIFRDLPMHESNDLIIDFLTTQHQLIHNGIIKWSFARDANNHISTFTNGDRYIDVCADFSPPLPKEVTIGKYPVRIWHSSQAPICKRCFQTDHFTGELSKCAAYLPLGEQKNILPFKSPLNVLTNFWMEDLHFENQIFLSAEHCYQWFFCMEMNDPITAEKVFKAKSAAAAKNIAQEVKSKDFADWNRKKVSIMRSILKAKAGTSATFSEYLIKTGGKYLVEATKGTFYGAGLTPHLCRTTNPTFYPGENFLGKLLMELRATLSDELKTSVKGSNGRTGTETARSATETAVVHSGPEALHADESAEPQPANQPRTPSDAQTGSASVPQLAEEPIAHHTKEPTVQKDAACAVHMGTQQKDQPTPHPGADLDCDALASSSTVSGSANTQSDSNCEPLPVLKPRDNLNRPNNPVVDLLKGNTSEHIPKRYSRSPLKATSRIRSSSTTSSTASVKGSGCTQPITRFMKRKQPTSPTHDNTNLVLKRIGVGIDNSDMVSVASTYDSCTDDMDTDIANLKDLDT